MQPAFLVRLRPLGPCRFGMDDGARTRSSSIGRSDMFFAALASAFKKLGWKDEWMAATAGSSEPAVRITSLFPFLGRTLYVAPPRSLWPPAATPRVRWKAATLVPAAIVQDLALGKPIREERWEIDTGSQCVIPAGAAPPFRSVIRRSAAVDRLGAASVDPHPTACIEFSQNAGLWAAIVFKSAEARDTWGPRIRAALRVLADSGIGGERSIGWGHFEQPEIQQGTFPELLMPEWSFSPASTSYWMLGLFNPGPADDVDWSAGHWTLDQRSRADSKAVQMVSEGSVVSANNSPTGRAVDVAHDGQDGPVWRAGFAVSISLPAPPPKEAGA